LTAREQIWKMIAMKFNFQPTIKQQRESI